MIATDGLPDSTERAATLAAQREKETLLQKKGLWHKQKLKLASALQAKAEVLQKNEELRTALLEDSEGDS